MSDAEMSEVEQGADASQFAYDPEQDADERRKVRRDYRKLTRKAEDQRANPNDYRTDQITNDVLEADKLFKNVKAPQDATLDSNFLVMATSMGAQRARAMKSGTGSFDVEDFLSKLVTYMGGQLDLPDDSDDATTNADDVDTGPPLDWDKIGRKVLAKSRRVPAMGFMLGPLSIEQKQRTAPKRVKYDKNKDEITRPQELKEGDIQKSENETTKNVAVLEKLLEELGGPINYFKFIVNPNDYAQSVENMFHLSFLIRDGKVSLELTDDDEPMIFLCSEPTDEDYQEGLKKRQTVLNFDMAVWRRAIEVFEITETFVPQRPPSKTRLGNKWYG